MEQREALLSAVDRLTRTDRGQLRCEVAGHPVGHTCLVANGSGLPALRQALRQALTARFGRSRSLAMGGYADPRVTARTGLPLLAPFGERIVEMRAWTDVGRWIGCGAARLDGGVRTVVVVAERDEPLVGLAGVTSWVDRIVAVTRWGTGRARVIDWPTVEARLGTPLPGDYRRLAETFGHGAFDGLLHLLVPGAGHAEGDIVRNTRWLGGWARRDGGDLWEPYAVHPAPGGLLQWGVSEADAEFFWLTGDPDPDRWPVLARGDTPGSWQRFACTTAEFLYRVLTDPLHPFSTARHRHEHRFESHDGPRETGAGSWGTDVGSGGTGAGSGGTGAGSGGTDVGSGGTGAGSGGTGAGSAPARPATEAPCPPVPDHRSADPRPAEEHEERRALRENLDHEPGPPGP